MSKYQGGVNANDLVYSTTGGLTKIEYMATLILSGIVSNSDMRMDSALTAKFAVRYAQNLIEELNEQNESK
jgi:hypothetical protein